MKLHLLTTNLKSAGFTMIELLIVIGIIAVLATAVLAAINPVDQINKATDAGLVSSSAELVKSIERYYVTADEYPWNTAAGTNPDSVYSNSNSNNWQSWVDEIEAVGEIKKGYMTKLKKLGDSDIDGFIYKAANNPSVNICFKPKSKQFRQDAVDNCVASAANLPNVAGYDACPQAAYNASTVWNDESLCVQ